MDTEIIIGADIVPTKTNIEFFESGNIEKIVDSSLLKILSEADYRIFNLEVPLTDKANPIKKCGPNLIAPTASINGIKATGVDFVTLANNHILDQGADGLQSTISVLKKAGIAYSGAGENLFKAIIPHIFEINNIKVGIYCCAEHEFSIATEKSAGANPFDALESFEHISKLKEECDYVIVLYHGGKEHYRYPSPYLQKVCRKIVERGGVDLVICQHSHCIGCTEKWKSGNIVYGQGNFLFDNSNSEFWQTSLLIKVNLEKKSLGFIPIVKNDNGVSLADDNERKDILDAFNDRSGKIKDIDFVQAEYNKFSKLMLEYYLISSDYICGSFVFKVLNKLTGKRLGKHIAKVKIKKYRERLIDYFECEAHRELIIDGLKEE